MAEPLDKDGKPSASGGVRESTYEELLAAYGDLPVMGGKSGEPKNTGKDVSSMLSRIKAFAESYVPTGAVKIGVTRKG